VLVGAGAARAGELDSSAIAANSTPLQYSKASCSKQQHTMKIIIKASERAMQHRELSAAMRRPDPGAGATCSCWLRWFMSAAC